MDSRTAAHVLSQIAAYLELKGENTFKCRAYVGAAKGLLTLGADDLAPLYESGELAGVRGLGPATLAVVRDLVETGESRYLEQLRESMPEGLLEMLDVPGMTPAKIHRVYEELQIQTVEELEAAATDGRLAKLTKFGPKTAAKILKGIATARERGTLRLYHHAVVEARQLLDAVRGHPDVTRAELAGAIRRKVEVASSADIVAACARDPAAVAQSFARLSGVRESNGDGARVSVHFVDGARLELHCVTPEHFGVALWRATGNAEHVAEVTSALDARGITIDGERLVDAHGREMTIADETAVYRAAGLGYIEPELREGTGEVAAAKNGTLPTLLDDGDIRGVLHCHSYYSDGKASIAEMARAAKDRGWSYLGITDHSQAAFYAGGLSREKVRQQHGEIDEVNATLDGFRVLKGIEADILADGQLDYGDELLDEFDFVVGSIHSRFSMEQRAMTDRVLRALDDPRLTILAHPTGRLLLHREPYGLDVNAVLEKAREVGIAVELNADPHRLDLDWRHLRRAKELGVPVEIGPDAHSTKGLDYMHLGVGIARKGWLEPGDVLNTRDANAIVAFARARRNTK
ncbi:MAG TPA: DNA polymerase/3'-5' exonuclease PolX [Gemmatimonadaceae bacterium]|nr:DNA polymerase/3'-5' exonuclease PolX [Gemmatimonadaceae bacterium]